MNKRGFTLIELLVSIVLVSIVLATMLSTLTKIKSTYNVIYSNTDVEIYGSSLSRIINNDINKNSGIKYINCDTDGKTCELLLANDSRRKIEIYDVTLKAALPATKCKNCSTERVSNTLRYSDAKTGKTIYIKTLSLYKTTTTKGATDDVDINGSIFGRMYATYVDFPNVNNTNYTSSLASLTIEINDTADVNDYTHNIMIYASSNFEKDMIKAGDEINVALNNSSINSNGVVASYNNFIIKYGVGFYVVSSNGTDGNKVYEKVNNLFEKVSNTKPRIDGSSEYVFNGYYITDPLDPTNKITIVDKNGNFVVSNTFFTDKDVVINIDWKLK